MINKKSEFQLKWAMDRKIQNFYPSFPKIFRKKFGRKTDIESLVKFLKEVKDNGIKSWLISHDDIAMTKAFLSAGIDIEKDGGGAVVWAAHNGNLEAIKFLFEQGVTLNKEQRSMAFIQAARRGHINILKKLKEKWVEKESQKQALEYAKSNCRNKAIELLS